MQNKSYIAIDLKSFYASVECVERGLDPINTCLVVADPTRTQKTICLAVSPALKSFGVPGRPRLFEAQQIVEEVNFKREKRLNSKSFSGSSYLESEVIKNSDLKLDFIIASPQMAKYMEISTKIFGIYMKYVAAEDIHVYSVDEVFIDVTNYLSIYKMSAHDLALKMIYDVLSQTGITATAGVGTNLYLSKIAMDIVAKKMPPDAKGVRIADLDELSYRKMLWDHTPITDFWRIGRGYKSRLAENGMFTMGDVARCSLENEEKLYNLFGINAELLIDHAWGWEPCTIKDIKSYKPESNSLSSGQVLQCPYDFDKARLVVKEMTDLLVLDLVEKGLVTDQMVLTVGYDVDNLTDKDTVKKYKGKIETDHYGRKIPKAAHGTVNLGFKTSSGKIIGEAVTKLFDEIVNRNLTVRRMYVVANKTVHYSNNIQETNFEQLNLFEEPKNDKNKMNKEDLEKEKNLQQAVISLKHRFGKNAVLKGMNLEEGATAKQRNEQVGGHKA